jgi:ATP phosphoribosyltransferase regulatory subunit
MSASELLPSGFYDLLPPDALKESSAVARLLRCFASFGYQEASPALIEFEQTLLSGRGAALGSQSFRLTDTLSQNMMGLRSDITLQMARIAASRLGAAPRPLRLGYAGPILRAQAEALRHERQLTQAGIELIGAEGFQADAEVIIVAGEALRLLGIEGISFDVNLAGLLSALCPEAAEDAGLRYAVTQAVAHKDTGLLASLPIRRADALIALIEAAGPVEKALRALEPFSPAQAEHLRLMLELAGRRCPWLSFTLDPLEAAGFDYHSGVSFSLFAPALRRELGRGGRYEVGGEKATGVTLYVTPLLALLPAPIPPQTALLGPDAMPETARGLREQGYATLHALARDGESLYEEARRLGCRFLVQQDKIEEIV